MTEKMVATFWGSADDERLTHTDMDDAIEDILENDAESLTGILTICGFAHLELPTTADIAADVLEAILERYAPDYGDPEGSIADDETPLMREAANVFSAIFRQEYRVWSCKIVEKRTIDVEKWVKENRPDWLE